MQYILEMQRQGLQNLKEHQKSFGKVTHTIQFENIGDIQSTTKLPAHPHHALQRGDYIV